MIETPKVPRVWGSVCCGHEGGPIRAYEVKPTGSPPAVLWIHHHRCTKVTCSVSFSQPITGHNRGINTGPFPWDLELLWQATLASPVPCWNFPTGLPRFPRSFSGILPASQSEHGLQPPLLSSPLSLVDVRPLNVLHGESCLIAAFPRTGANTTLKTKLYNSIEK